MWVCVYCIYVYVWIYVCVYVQMCVYVYMCDSVSAWQTDIHNQKNKHSYVQTTARTNLQIDDHTDAIVKHNHTHIKT